MSKRYYKDPQRDADYLAKRLAEAARSWAVGDKCLGFTGARVTTTIVKIDGDILYLANGQSGHRTRVRPLEGAAAVPLEKIVRKRLKTRTAADLLADKRTRSRNSNFGKGSGTYTCEDCGRRTRDTGGGEGDLRVCRWCMEIQMIENAISDGQYTEAQGAAEIARVEKQRDAQ